MIDHVYHYLIRACRSTECELWVRLQVRSEGFWVQDMLVPESAFEAYNFTPRAEWRALIDPEYMPPGCYRHSVPFNGFMKITRDNRGLDMAMWRNVEVFAKHYSKAFGDVYAISLVGKRTYGSSNWSEVAFDKPGGPPEGPDPYELANREADALMEMDTIEQEVAELNLKVYEALVTRNTAVTRWQELNDECGPRRREPNLFTQWRVKK